MSETAIETSCTICNVCDDPQRLEDAQDVAQIASNVRKFQDERFTVWRCGACRSLHCKEEVDLDHYYRHYPLQHHRLGYLTRQAYVNRLRILRRAGLQSHHRVLDYGCGNGLLISMMHQRGFRSTQGYDPYIDRFADPEVLTHRYDLVYSFGVIEHVREPDEFLRQQRELVHDQGRVVIATPNAEGIRLDQPDALLLHQPYHRHILSEQALAQRAAQEGFRLVEVYHRNWLDTLHPAMNSRFVTDYLHRTGGMVDALFEPVRLGIIFRSPRLWWSLYFGYFFPPSGYMIAVLEAV